jgi:DNA-binding PadR family transcriptional regulator
MERELLLLGLLRQQDMHGYQLTEFIDRALSFCSDIKKPTAYALLDKMAHAGWITETERREGNRPPRKVYSITPQGEKEFQKLLRENLASQLPSHFSGDIGIAFMDALNAGECVALLKQRREKLAEASRIATTAPQHQGSMQLVVKHQALHLAAELNWLDEVIEHLSQKVTLK